MLGKKKKIFIGAQNIKLIEQLPLSTASLLLSSI